MTDDMLKLAREAVSQLVSSGSSSDTEALGAIRVNLDPDGLPPAIVESHQHASGLAEVQEFSISVYRLPFGGDHLHVVILTPEANDGWFEAYTAEGALVGAGQFIGRRLAWADRAEVRACAAATSLPEATLPALRHQLVWVMQPDGSCHSACGRFHIRQSGGVWGVAEFPGDCATLSEAQELAQELSAYVE